MGTHTINVPDEKKLLSGLFNNLGLATGKDAPATATAMLRRAVALDPFDPARRVNLASILIGRGEDDEAETLLTAALTQDPNIESAWQMLGVLKTHRRQGAQALACFERALALNPHHPQRKFDVCAAYLRMGDFARGLPLYEHRAEILPRTAPPPPAPTWTGEPTGHIAVWGDQGHGDRIQFARFLPWVKERAKRISFLTDPGTVALMHGYQDAGIADVGCFYPPDTKFDHQICVSSLPLVYGLTPDNIPPDPGLLTPAASTNVLTSPGLKIGIAWHGNKDHPNDNIRSMPFAELLALAADPRNDLFSLQCGPASADLAKARAQRLIGDMSGMIEGEWAHTAAVIKNLDLVVTVDTAIAHLAGALKVRTFLLLPVFPDWRWMMGRDDTPWYPTMRLFRQDKAFDWRGVMKRVVAAVNKTHEDNAVVRMLMSGNVRTAAPGAGKAAQWDPHAPGTADEKEPDVAAVLRKVLRQGDCFVDVGANIGMHTVLAAELVGEKGKVLAFEPGSNNLPTLHEAMEWRPGRGEIEAVPKPCWHAAEPVTFHLCAEGGGGDALWDPGEFPTNTLSREKQESSVMQATTLDAEILSRKLKPRLIKIDTEGAEEHVLRGASTVLELDHPPFIVAELHEFGLAKLGCSQDSLRGFMRRKGYDTYLLFTDGLRPVKVPDDQLVASQYIVNLLFSTDADVEAVWPEPATSENRPQLRYVPVERAA